MNFMFEWQKLYLTSERSERVRYRFCHENIKFIYLSQRVMFFLLYGDQMYLKLRIFISLFSKNRASFTNHRSSLQKIQSTRVQYIETLTEFQSNKIHEILVN